MSEQSRSDLVLVTGATGFIAMHCIVELLRRGYRVRGTARTLRRETGLRQALGRHVELGDRFDLVGADLTLDSGWAEAVADCRYVLHVASPIPRTPPKHEDELIVPAREGALRVLRAASKAGVERVVMTSSVAAVLYGRDRSRTFDESDWSDIDSKKIGAYEKSKTIAERAAWDFVQTLPEGERLELTTINPGLVLGPLLDADWGTSGEAIKKLMERDFPACPDLGWAPVDVRDVATAHVEAMIRPEAAGERFICAIEHASMRDIAAILDRHLKDRGFRIPTGRLPGFVMRLLALFDKTARLALNDLGVRQDVDNGKIRRVLDWQPRSLETMVTDMADSLIEHGVVEPPKAA
ncbi:MAG: NAD-dependent epimerase/dehydratase family protein [Acidobacteria bacterium]|nr:MAG: NAD-dependent epimerase/dehydratase family protein [Acidobacteriota bacterium]REK00907.1 MAG: NAD-dependent epimerase/dehydratase family protein [Acidobacteriota bacterium]